MSTVSVKAHLCWHSKYNDSIGSDTCVSFNLNSSCNSSDSAQEQGSAQASLLFWGWVTALHRCPCKSQIIGDAVWSDVRVLTCTPKWLGRFLVRTDSTQGQRNTARLLSCLDYPCVLLEFWVRQPLAAVWTCSNPLQASLCLLLCSFWHLLGPMVLTLDIIQSYVKEIKSLIIYIVYFYVSLSM